MTQLEIIHLRASSETADEVAEQIRSSLDAADTNTGVVTFYRRKGLETDVAIHIRRHGEESMPGPSPAGLQLAAALKTRGLVEHTLWEEME